VGGHPLQGQDRLRGDKAGIAGRKLVARVVASVNADRQHGGISEERGGRQGSPPMVPGDEADRRAIAQAPRGGVQPLDVESAVARSQQRVVDDHAGGGPRSVPAGGAEGVTEEQERRDEANGPVAEGVPPHHRRLQVRQRQVGHEERRAGGSSDVHADGQTAARQDRGGGAALAHLEAGSARRRIAG